ncbi:MAG: response regulator transcription factor [Bradyrhizobium sp.]|nr:response regulator transcription factor [Bradyrhizobium sp.]
MDQAATDIARENDPQEQIASALGGGIIFVDSDGQIVWINESTRDRLNGGLKELVLPLQKADALAIDCFVSAVPVTINGEQSVVCVIQETKESDHDLMSAIESVVADTSSFTRTIIDRLRGLRQQAKPAVPFLEVESLTQREREVLGLICEGHTDIAMSKKLKLSENTVRNHIASLYRKIGVNRRSAAIIWARERAITSQANLGVKPRKHLPVDSQDR